MVKSSYFPNNLKTNKKRKKLEENEILKNLILDICHSII